MLFAATCAVLLVVLGVGSSALSASTSTLGVATVGSLSDQGGPGYLDVSGPYTTAGGTTTSLSASIAGESQALSVRGVVYTDAGGKPGSLVATTNEVVVPVGAAQAWVTLPFSSTVTLPSGGYWLGFWYGSGTGSGTGGGFAYADASGSEWYAPAGYSATGNAPSGFPSGAASSSSRYSVYATVAGSATTPTTTTTASTPTPTPTPVTTSSGSLGVSAVGTSSELGGAGYLDVDGPYALSSAATASKLVAYVAGGSSAGTIRPVVYQAASGSPGALVAVGPPVSIAANQSAGWVDLPLGSTASLAAGSYYVGFWYGGSVRIYESTTANVERYAADAYSATARPNDPFGSAGSSSSAYSVYLPYTAASGSTPPPTTTTTTSTTTATTTTTTPTPAPPSTSTTYEDSREGFPKIAAYRPGCGTSGSQAAQFDWFVTDGACTGAIDNGYAQNPSLLGLIQPNNANGDLFAATYGAYDTMTSSVNGLRPFQSSDWLHDTSGAVHAYGSVTVLNWLSADTAQWSADVVAYWAKQEGAGSSSHPGIAGIWGDNDFWGDQGYAFAGTALDPSAVGSSTASANQATWDTNVVAHHDRLASDLPGMVIGGNDVSSYASSPSSYRGSQANGWLLPGMSSAGMRECADQYFGLYNADGVDSIVNAAQQYLAGKALDGKQRYLMLNNCNATSTQVNEYSLAVATIAGMYYWPYTNGDWSTTLSIAPSIPDVTHNGTRNWLGAPTAAPQRLATGLWKRTFEHGVVYANMSGSTQTVDGHTLGNESGLFVAG